MRKKEKKILKLLGLPARGDLNRSMLALYKQASAQIDQGLALFEHADRIRRFLAKDDAK